MTVQAWRAVHVHVQFLFLTFFGFAGAAAAPPVSFAIERSRIPSWYCSFEFVSRVFFSSGEMVSSFPSPLAISSTAGVFLGGLVSEKNERM